MKIFVLLVLASHIRGWSTPDIIGKFVKESVNLKYLIGANKFSTAVSGEKSEKVNDRKAKKASTFRKAAISLYRAIVSNLIG